MAKAESELSRTFEYVFPAIAGVQAGRPYYTTMCPLHLIPRIFLFDEEDLMPELRAQRSLNKQRIPEMARYMLSNPKQYVFSALTASIDGDLEFIPTDSNGILGQLHVPMSARFVINDGQHRRAAIEEALSQEPSLGNETISVVFFHDKGLKRSQQMFADLNKYAIRPSTSLGILYDHRDPIGAISKRLCFESPVFRGMVEMEKTSLSARSRKLFTLSAIHSANRALFRELSFTDRDENEAYEISKSFWGEVDRRISAWSKVRNGDVSASEVRQDYIHSHGVTLQALGLVGNALIRLKSSFAAGLKRLEHVDWHRSNRKDWEGRAMYSGKLSKSVTNITLTAAQLKRHLGLPLSSEEVAAETAAGFDGVGEGARDE